MNQNWSTINKSLGIIEILFGISVMILSIFSWYTILTNLEQFGLRWEGVSFIKLIEQSHFVFLIGLLGLVSGILLIKRKRLGWITSAASLLVYPIGMALIIVARHNEGKDLLEDRLDYIITGMIMIIFFVLAFTLTLKPIRDFYGIKIRDWAYSGTIVILFALDKLVIN